MKRVLTKKTQRFRFRPHLEQLEDRIVLACDTAPAGLVGCWSGDGNALDSVDDNDGVLVGGTSYDAGQLGDAFSLDGVDDFVSIPDAVNFHDSLRESITISAWINWDGSSDEGQVVAYGDGHSSEADTFLFLFVQNGQIHWRTRMPGGSTTTRIASSTLSENEWHHLVAVREFGNTVDGIRLYVDGALVDSDGDTGTVFKLGSFASRPMTIGVRNVYTSTGGFAYFPGLIDQVEIYDRDLSADEIDERYQAGLKTIVDIDVKPGSDPNSINLGSNGNVPVAILSTDTFDATTVDPATVTLADAGVKVRGNGRPQASEEDVNDDGLMDLVVHIDTDGLQLTEGDEEATLEGETFDGDAIEGTDSVRVVATLLATSTGDALVSCVPHLDSITANSLLSPSLDFEIVVSDLPVGVLGTAELLSSGLGRITLDASANGVGWFVDSTPIDNSEFAWSTEGELVAHSGSRAAGRYDLLTVLHHEIEHLLGAGHDEHGLMAPTLLIGERHLDDHSSPIVGTDSLIQSDLIGEDRAETSNSLVDLLLPEATDLVYASELEQDDDFSVDPLEKRIDEEEWDLLIDSLLE